MIKTAIHLTLDTTHHEGHEANEGKNYPLHFLHGKKQSSPEPRFSGTPALNLQPKKTSKMGRVLVASCPTSIVKYNACVA